MGEKSVCQYCQGKGCYYCSQSSENQESIFIAIEDRDKCMSCPVWFICRGEMRSQCFPGRLVYD